MEQQQNETSSSGTTLQVLKLYPPGLKCITRNGITCEVVGFDFREDESVMIEHLDEEGVWQTDWVNSNILLPVLYAFEDLVKPFPSGEVPAVEVAQAAGYELAALDPSDPYDQYAVLTDDIICMEGAQGEIIELSADGVLIVHGTSKVYSKGYYDTHNMADYLRSRHFAVGLEPHQYVRKIN